MNFELVDQSVQYTFLNPKYEKDGTKTRILKNVKQNATAAGLARVGTALAVLQGDKLADATLIQKHAISLTDEED